MAGDAFVVVDEVAASVQDAQERERIEQGASSIISELVQGDLSRIDSKIVGQAAQQGDELALSIVRRTGWIIGLGMVERAIKAPDVGWLVVLGYSANSRLKARDPNAENQQPAFAGQTRACGVTSDVAFDVTVLAEGLEHPWAVEPLLQR